VRGGSVGQNSIPQIAVMVGGKLRMLAFASAMIAAAVLVGTSSFGSTLQGERVALVSKSAEREYQRYLLHTVYEDPGMPDQHARMPGMRQRTGLKRARSSYNDPRAAGTIGWDVAWRRPTGSSSKHIDKYSTDTWTGNQIVNKMAQESARKPRGVKGTKRHYARRNPRTGKFAHELPPMPGSMEELEKKV